MRSIGARLHWLARVVATPPRPACAGCSALSRACDKLPPNGRCKMPCLMIHSRWAGVPSSSKPKLANCSVTSGAKLTLSSALP